MFIFTDIYRGEPLLFVLSHPFVQSQYTSPSCKSTATAKAGRSNALVSVWLIEEVISDSYAYLRGGGEGSRFLLKWIYIWLSSHACQSKKESMWATKWLQLICFYDKFRRCKTIKVSASLRQKSSNAFFCQQMSERNICKNMRNSSFVSELKVVAWNHIILLSEKLEPGGEDYVLNECHTFSISGYRNSSKHCPAGDKRQLVCKDEFEEQSFLREIPSLYKSYKIYR